MPIQERQMLNKQHAVPQNIMDVEFKLVGDLTMRQFAYLLVFGVLAYFTARTVGGIFKWPFTGFFILIGLGLAFVPIQERGMDEWIVNFLKAIYSETRLVWHKGTFVPTAFMYDNIAVVQQELITLAPTSSRRKLEEYLTSYQKQEIDPLDIPERDYIMKVRSAFANSAVVQQDQQAMYGGGVQVSVVEPVSELPQPTYQEVVQEADVASQLPISPVVQVQTFVDTANDSQVAATESPVSSTPVSLPEPVMVQPQVSVTPPIATPISAVVPPISNMKPVVAAIKPATPKPVQKAVSQTQPKKRSLSLNVPSVRPKESFTVLPMTPDRHSGRRFTSLLPTTGELVLPIRGEKVLKTSEEIAIDDDIGEKAKKLQGLIAQIKSQEMITREESLEVVAQDIPAATVEQVKEVEVAKEAGAVADALKQKNIQLTEEIEHLKRTVESGSTKSTDVSDMVTKIDELEKSKQVAANEYEVLQRQMLELQNRLREKGSVSNTSLSAVIKPSTPAQVKPLTDEKDIVSGIVTDDKGNVVHGLVLMIKNSKGEAVRAVKTDTLGNFVLSTPLDRGVYTVEPSPSSNLDLRFDIISVEINGSVLPPIQLTGRVREINNNG